LAALSFRSKAHWGYTPEFMESIRSFLDPSSYIADWPVYLAEDNGEIAGFYGFRRNQGEVFLHDLFIEPKWIGQGVGKQLWQHALQTASDEQYGKFLIESDPFAEEFYIKMGAKRIGEIVSPGSHRALPLLEFTLCP